MPASFIRIDLSAFLRGLAIFALLLVGHHTAAQEPGSIQGKVTDASGAPVLGAVVTVEIANGPSHKTVTDGDGAFQISPLPVGNYSVKISASGLSDWYATNVPASAPPQTKPVLAVMQVAPAVTTVTVGLSPDEVATEQLSHEVKQRALAVIPNFFVSYDKHPAPLSPKQKLHLSLKTLLDPATIAAAGITAGIQQEMNSYYQFGQGAQGYAKRFGAAYGTAATNLLITSVAADSVLHQDPRYFYSGEGSKLRRAWYAIESAFRAKGDNGKWQPPYAGMVGAMASAEIANFYYPGTRTQYSLLGRSLMFHFAGLAGVNLAEELFLKKLTSNTPEDQTAKAPVLREGSAVTLIAVGTFGASGATAGQTTTFVLAQDLTVSGTVLARTGAIATGVVTQVSAGNAPGEAASVALKNMTLRAGDVNVPLRSNQIRGAAAPVQYKELPGSGKVELTLFVAENVEFPATQ